MPSTRREPGKQPAPKGRPADQQEIARLKQQVTALEERLSSFLKEQEDRKKFFVAK